MSDSIVPTIRDYRDGRLAVLIQGKEYCTPAYEVIKHEDERNEVANENLGFYRNVGVTVTEAKSGELVLSFQTRIPVEVIET